MEGRECLRRSCCPSEGDWPRASRLLLHMEMRDGALITAASFGPVCCCVYAHKRERLAHVRTQVPSTRGRCGVLGQLRRQMKIVSTLLHGEGFLSLWTTGPIRRARVRVRNDTLVFIIQSPPARVRIAQELLHRASLVTIFPNLAACVKRNGVLRNQSV